MFFEFWHPLRVLALSSPLESKSWFFVTKNHRMVFRCSQLVVGYCMVGDLEQIQTQNTGWESQNCHEHLTKLCNTLRQHGKVFFKSVETSLRHTHAVQKLSFWDPKTETVITFAQIRCAQGVFSPLPWCHEIVQHFAPTWQRIFKNGWNLTQTYPCCTETKVLRPQNWNPDHFCPDNVPQIQLDSSSVTVLKGKVPILRLEDFRLSEGFRTWSRVPRALPYHKNIPQNDRVVKMEA